MTLRKAARKALDTAVEKVCSMGISLKDALMKLLYPLRDGGLLVVFAIYDAVCMMHDLLNTAKGICREVTRQYLEAMAMEAKSRLRLAAAN